MQCSGSKWQYQSVSIDAAESLNKPALPDPSRYWNEWEAVVLIQSTAKVIPCSEDCLEHMLGLSNYHAGPNGARHTVWYANIFPENEAVSISFRWLLNCIAHSATGPRQGCLSFYVPVQVCSWRQSPSCNVQGARSKNFVVRGREIASLNEDIFANNEQTETDSALPLVVTHQVHITTHLEADLKTAMVRTSIGTTTIQESVQ
ncbi:hypothetical protein BDD12DRAFT_979815 [Trichophaea hybrida]|nr:hypothetical protein BDD12DRAFT_979815 [Trichophaea hybrida]